MRSSKRLVWVFAVAAAVTLLCFAAACKTSGADPGRYASEEQSCVSDAGEAGGGDPSVYRLVNYAESEVQSLSGGEEKDGKKISLAIRIVILSWLAADSVTLIVWTAGDLRHKKRTAEEGDAEHEEKTSEDEDTSDDASTSANDGGGCE